MEILSNFHLFSANARIHFFLFNLFTSLFRAVRCQGAHTSAFSFVGFMIVFRLIIIDTQTNVLVSFCESEKKYHNNNTKNKIKTKTTLLLLFFIICCSFYSNCIFLIKTKRKLWNREEKYSAKCGVRQNTNRAANKTQIIESNDIRNEIFLHKNTIFMFCSFITLLTKQQQQQQQTKWKKCEEKKNACVDGKKHFEKWAWRKKRRKTEVLYIFIQCFRIG